MTAIWILVCSLFILLGLEIRLRIAFMQISEWKYGMDRLSEEIKQLKYGVTAPSKAETEDDKRFKL